MVNKGSKISLPVWVQFEAGFKGKICLIFGESTPEQRDKSKRVKADRAQWYR